MDDFRPVQKIALSSGSACTSASLEPSYVLRALGTCDPTLAPRFLSRMSFIIPCSYSFVLSGAAEDMAHSSLRFGIGRFTTEAEIDYVIKEIVGTVNKLRDMRSVSLPSLWPCMPFFVDDSPD